MGYWCKYWNLYLYAAIIKRANVFAFEPISIPQHIVKKYKLNCLQNKIKIFNFGLGNKIIFRNFFMF